MVLDAKRIGENPASRTTKAVALHMMVCGSMSGFKLLFAKVGGGKGSII